jgi:hypothetical protein
MLPSLRAGEAMNIVRKGGASFAAVALGLLSACAADDQGGVSPQSREQDAQSSATVIVNPRKCIARQAGHTWPTTDRLQRITERVLSDPDRVPPEAIRRFARNIRNAVEDTKRACGDEATELNALAELVLPTPDTGIDEPLLHQIVGAFERWGRAIGRQRETRIVYFADPCVPLRKKVHASYEVLYRPEAGGTKVWIDLVLVNEWDTTVYMDHGGQIEATGVRPDGATRTYQWGGSSADTAGARPGRTSRTRVAPVPATGPEPSPIHLFSYGDIRVFDVFGSAYSAIGPCRIVVEPAE